jgi:flagellar basal-body rod protein FlgG
MAIRALRTAASGMYAQQINIETIANNIANVNTTAFKKNRAEFKDLMYQEVYINPQATVQPGIIGTTDTKIVVGNGVQPASTSKIFKQGDLVASNGPLDFAILGEGFFQIRKPDGNFAYTRDGSFKLSAEGYVTTADGYIVEPGIVLTDNINEISVSADGTITGIDTAGNSIELGTIQIAKFINPAGLKAIGDNLYIETEASGRPIVGKPGDEGFGGIKQNYLEHSNVDIVEEMVNMITAQRAYEVNSKTIQTAEDMMQMTNNLKR